jgi:anaerobic ribonucleoside-triphosphate reductase
MVINIKTNKNFETTLNKLVEKYGEEFEYLNGFHESQTNFSEFTNAFIGRNVADVTIDGNANAAHRDIVSLRTEKDKPLDKVFAFSKIFYEINKKYGLKVAREWLEAEYSGAFYLHDAPSSSFVPYSYKGTETIVVKYKGELLLTTFSDLYNLVDGEIELLNEEDSAYCKYTNDLYVWDTNNTWTKVIRVIQKPKTHNFHFIKANNGMSEIVTSNHPVITTDGDKLASELNENDFVYTESFDTSLFGDVDTLSCLGILLKSKKSNRSILFRGEPVYNATDELINKQGQVCYFNATNPVDNIIKLDYDFGWLVGMIIADGHCSHDIITITQNRGSILDKLISICEDRHYGYVIHHKENNCVQIVIRSNVLADVIYSAFICDSGSLNIHLQPDILKYNKEFIKGIIGGVLDGDGTLTQAQGRRIHIRVTSRALINQLAFIIRCFGYTVREQSPSAPNFNENAFIHQKNYIYHLAFTPYCDVENFNSIKIAEHSVEYTSKSLEGRYTNGQYTFGYGEKQISNNIELSYDNDEFVYDISVETGHFMCNNILSHNCYAYDLTRLATEGLFFLDNYNNEPPQHLTTYFDDVIEYISFFCNRSSGAVGLPNVLVWSFYYWMKDVKDGYYIKNPEYYIRQNFQKFVHRLNQPFLRVDQSAFTNVSIFDRYYVEALFGGVEFPDGTFLIDYVDEFIEHQKIFMEVVSEIRNSNMFTFPVLTYSLLKRDDITEEEAEEMIKTGNFDVFKDNKFARWCSDHNTVWNDSNFFLSNNVGTLSNCPLAPDTKILYYSERYHKFFTSNIGDIYDDIQRKPEDKRTIPVMSNGKLIDCKINKFNEVADYKITLANGESIVTTGSHLNKVYAGDYKKTSELTTDDYLPYSRKSYEGLNQLSSVEGYLIGAFLGDGSYRNDSQVTFSLNRQTKSNVIDFIYANCPSKFAATISETECKSSISNEYSCVNVSVNSKYLRSLIEMFVVGTSALNKGLDGLVYNQSIEFRQAILQGIQDTDGGNLNRLYTSSERLKDDIVTLCATLGIVTNVTSDTRDGRLGTNPCYTIRMYVTDAAKTKQKDVYIKDDDYFWVKIKSIERIQSKCKYSYCLEVQDDSEPIFMLANGIMTHNCRLLSDTSKLDAFINSIGGTALSIGSVKVNTINLQRIYYEVGNSKEKYLKRLRERVELCCKVLDRVRHIIKRNVEKGLLPNYCDGGIELEKQYCTVGCLGLYEVIKSFGFTKTDKFGYISYTDEGLEFAREIFDVMNEVKDNFTNEFSFNIESVPAERAAVILCSKDNLLFRPDTDMYIYSNQWIPLTEKCTINEKLRLSSELDKMCGGGAIAHINIDNNFPNAESAWKMLNMIALRDVIYFAFNTRINVCKNHHGFVGTNTCPHCGEPVYDTYQRIVGFLVPSKAYSKERFKEFNARQWYSYAEMLNE